MFRNAVPLIYNRACFGTELNILSPGVCTKQKLASLVEARIREASRFYLEFAQTTWQDNANASKPEAYPSGAHASTA